MKKYTYVFEEERKEVVVRKDINGFFKEIVKIIAFGDCTGERVENISFEGEVIEYAGWNPDNEYIFINKRTGDVVFDGYFPQYEH